MKLNALRNKKGSALLWCILLTIIITILLGAINLAVYAYFNYTMTTVKRQQAYFTARSAVNIVLENLSSEEQKRAAASNITDTTASGETRTVNFDGNYINAAGDVIDKNGEVIYSHNKITGTDITKEGYLIEDYDKKSVVWEDFEFLGLKIRYPKFEEKKIEKRDKLVRKAAQSSSGTYTGSSENIALLPAKNSSITVTSFGLDETMGTASALIERSDDDVVTISVTAYYPDKENGEKYEIKATAARQPVYFGGIAAKNLTINGNLTLADNTDFYWNSTDEFNPSGNSTGSIKNPQNKKLKIKGNLVTKGDATITKGTSIAGKYFLDDVKFSLNSGDISQKIWNSSQYIISNKTLLVGEANTSYVKNSGLIDWQKLTNTSTYYCNSRGKKEVFGGYAEELGGAIGFDDLLDRLGLGDMQAGLLDSNMALTNSENDALAIQYIEILSLSTAVANELAEQSHDAGWIRSIFNQAVVDAYNRLINGVAYDTLDVSYIDFNSRDENNRSDEVVPLTYMFLRGGEVNGLTARVRYGCDPGNRTRIGSFIENVSDNVGNLVTNVFDIDNKPSYLVVYLENKSTIHLGWNGDNKRDTNDNPGTNVFLYSIYGGEGTTVYLHDDVVVLGEIVCDNLIVDGDAQIVYTSTSGAQVAKQKIAEFWTVSNYSD